MNEDIQSRLRDFEDGFTERKTEGAANASELRRTLVALPIQYPAIRPLFFLLGSLMTECQLVWAIQNLSKGRLEKSRKGEIHEYGD